MSRTKTNTSRRQFHYQLLLLAPRLISTPICRTRYRSRRLALQVGIWRAATSLLLLRVALGPGRDMSPCKGSPTQFAFSDFRMSVMDSEPTQMNVRLVIHLWPTYWRITVGGGVFMPIYGIFPLSRIYFPDYATKCHPIRGISLLVG